MNIELKILKAMAVTADFMTPEGALYNDVVLGSAKPPTRSEVAVALRMLEGKSEVVGVSNEDTGTRWQIADAGKARLMNAGI